MADITVSYKGNTIAEVSASGTTTLGTSGKYCEDDISIAYTKPSGGSYIGGTVAWNQLVQNGDFANGTTNWLSSYGTGSFVVNSKIASFTANRRYGGPYQVLAGTRIAGHKYYLHTKVKATTATNQIQVLCQGSGTAVSVYTKATTDWQTVETIDSATMDFSRVTIRDNRTSGWDSIQFTNFMVIDLTQMLGSTIADYAYTLESGTAGAGIAWLKANGFFNSAYYPYDAGTLKSVETFAHPFKDSNGKIIGYFPMNFDLELRGIPKLDANNVLYYDGDEYDGNGTVTRKYGIVDLGTLNWQKTSGKNNLFNTTLSLSTAAYGGSNNAVCKAACAKYVSASITNTYTNEADKTVSFTVTGYCYIEDSAYTDAETFKTAMSGIYLVYELATPTTETV